MIKQPTGTPWTEVVIGGIALPPVVHEARAYERDAIRRARGLRQRETLLPDLEIVVPRREAGER